MNFWELNSSRKIIFEQSQFKQSNKFYFFRTIATLFSTHFLNNRFLNIWLCLVLSWIAIYQSIEILFSNTFMFWAVAWFGAHAKLRDQLQLNNMIIWKQFWKLVTITLWWETNQYILQRVWIFFSQQSWIKVKRFKLLKFFFTNLN